MTVSREEMLALAAQMQTAFFSESVPVKNIALRKAHDALRSQGANMPFVCPCCGTRGTTDGKASTVSGSYSPPESANASWSKIDKEFSAYVQVVRATAFEECAKIAEQRPAVHAEWCIADPDAVRSNAADRIRAALKASLPREESNQP